MTKIVRCRVENILGAKEVEFSPMGDSVTIGGKNGQGKSSAIWALIMALGGKKQVPEKPVRDGAAKGSVVIELDDLVVRMEVDSDRECKVRVESKEGARYSSPQSMLSALFGNLSFDPGAFMTLERASRVDTLFRLVGLDFTELNERAGEVCEERRELGREVRVLQAQLDSAPFNDDVGLEEVDISATITQIQEAQQKAQEILTIQTDIREIEDDIRKRREDNEKRNEQIKVFERVIEDHIQMIRDNDEMVGLYQQRVVDLAADGAKINKDYAPSETLPRLRLLLGDAERVNAIVRANKQRTEIEQRFTEKKCRHEGCEQELENIAAQKVELLKATSFPIDGLSFDGDDITFNGIPFAQVSESQKWEISTAIGFALNNRGIVFLRSSGGLDKDSRERIRQRAAECGVQLFMEVVDDADDVQILIEDGTVKANRLVEEQPKEVAA